MHQNTKISDFVAPIVCNININHIGTIIMNELLALQMLFCALPVVMLINLLSSLGKVETLGIIASSLWFSVFIYWLIYII